MKEREIMMRIEIGERNNESYLSGKGRRRRRKRGKRQIEREKEMGPQGRELRKGHLINLILQNKCIIIII